MRGMASSTSTVRSRQVSAELRRLRQERGFTAAEIADRLGMSASKISRIETGVRGLRESDVAAMLGLLEVPEQRREELLAMVRSQDKTGWWQTQGSGLPELWKDLIDLESRATRIHNFELAFVPGLLQTADYSAAVIQGIRPMLPESDLARLVGSRMTRQLILRKQDKVFLFVVDESVLRRSIGEPGVMGNQLRHLASFQDRPNIRLRVVPAISGAYAGLRGPFMILDFKAEPSVAYYENHGTCMFPEAKDDVAAYRQALRDILATALSPADSVELINAVAAEAPQG